MSAAYRLRLYRLIFWLAAIYNVAFGLWTCLWPQAFFSWMKMPPPNYPGLWQCLGMVVGLYGILYASAAVQLDRAKLIIAVGLAGKILGPIGLGMGIAAGEWPLRALTLVVFNDLVWWLPFTLFLLDETWLGRALRTSAPWACCAANAAAGLGLLLVSRNEIGAILSAKEGFPSPETHLTLWRVTWVIWMCAGVSLVAFYAWWGAWIHPRLTIIALLVAMAGLVSDLLAESLLIEWPTDRLASIEPLAWLLSGGIANACYAVGGVILTLGTPFLRGFLRVWAWLIWSSGFALTILTLLRTELGTIISMASLILLLVPWVAVFGWSLQRHLQVAPP